MDQINRIEAEDQIYIENEDGNSQTYTVDAVIEMNQKEYVIYSNENEMLISQLVQEDDEDILEDVSDEEIDQLMDAYEQALKEESE